VFYSPASIHDSASNHIKVARIWQSRFCFETTEVANIAGHPTITGHHQQLWLMWSRKVPPSSWVFFVFHIDCAGYSGARNHRSDICSVPKYAGAQHYTL
jgi:hypothetical protein